MGYRSTGSHGDAEAVTHTKGNVSCEPVLGAPKVSSAFVNECRGDASEAETPQEVKGLQSIQKCFERMNADQMRDDEYGAIPPVWLLFLAAFVCLTSLLVADTLYSAFFYWMTGTSL